MSEDGTAIRKRRLVSTLLVLLAVLLMSHQIVFAVDVSLSWQANTEPDLAGYRVFARQSDGSYDYDIPAWDGTGSSCTVTGLTASTSYCFVIRAYDDAGNESSDSDETCFEGRLLMISTSADRSNAVELEDQTATGDIYVFVSPTDGVEQANFFVDDPEMENPAYQVEDITPFDLGGTGGGGEALPFDTSELANGVHEITVSLQLNSGATHILSSAFTVAESSSMNPSAHAGADRTVLEWDNVVLDGTGSYDPDGDVTTYAWIQTAGTAVVLSNANTASPSFNAPATGVAGNVLRFSLTVTDNDGLTDTDSVTINATDTNQSPVSDAGDDQTVYEGDTVALDGSGSYDAQGDITYSWVQTAGTTVALSQSASAGPHFTAPETEQGGVTLVFRLTVTDEDGVGSTDTCQVHVENVLYDAVFTGLAIVGPATVNETSSVQYKATATFSDGTTEAVTQRVTWSQDSAYADVSSNGVLTSVEVPTDETVTINATYTHLGVTKTDEKMVTILATPLSNLAPNRPVIVSPYDGETGCEIRLRVITETFSDPDGDAHGQSRWQISEVVDFSTLILDAMHNDQLTELRIPHTLLKPDTMYYVRVRFYDVFFEPSEQWSEIVEFTTALSTDHNDDGIPDDQQVGAAIDLNNDGIADNDQPESIKSVESIDGSVAIGVSGASENVANIEAVEFIDPDTITDKGGRPALLPYGLCSYRIQVTEPGAVAQIKVYFDQEISATTTFYKYDSLNGWQDYSDHTIDRGARYVTLEVKDGDYGDCDGTTNGIIVDPGGLGGESGSVSGTATTADTGGSSTGGGCFIASGMGETHKGRTSMPQGKASIWPYCRASLILFALTVGCSVFISQWGRPLVSK